MKILLSLLLSLISIEFSYSKTTDDVLFEVLNRYYETFTKKYKEINITVSIVHFSSDSLYLQIQNSYLRPLKYKHIKYYFTLENNYNVVANIQREVLENYEGTIVFENLNDSILEINWPSGSDQWTGADLYWLVSYGKHGLEIKYLENPLPPDSPFYREDGWEFDINEWIHKDSID